MFEMTYLMDEWTTCVELLTEETKQLWSACTSNITMKFTHI